jgi:hypothetical protein
MRTPCSETSAIARCPNHASSVVPSAHHDDLVRRVGRQPVEKSEEFLVGRGRCRVSGQRNERAVVVEEEEAATSRSPCGEDLGAVVAAEQASAHLIDRASHLADPRELLPSPTDDVVTPQPAPHGLVASALLGLRHRESRGDRLGDALHVVGVDDERLAEFARGARRVAEDEHTGAVGA